MTTLLELKQLMIETTQLMEFAGELAKAGANPAAMTPATRPQGMTPEDHVHLVKFTSRVIRGDYAGARIVHKNAPQAVKDHIAKFPAVIKAVGL